MKPLRAAAALFDAWTTGVAVAVIGAIDRVFPPRRVKLTELDDGDFAIEGPAGTENVPTRAAFAGNVLSAGGLASLLRGSRVEIVLQSRRFLFRRLELPTRAAEFLDGIVLAQIDRLTPWGAAEAVFGCSAPAAGASDGVTTLIAATRRDLAMRYVGAVSNFQPAAVAICVETTEANAARVQVFEQKGSGYLEVSKLSRMLQVGFAGIALGALLCVLASAYLAESLTAQEAGMARQISARRLAILNARDGGDRAPIAALERRKHETPASVIALEALSEVLPDHTYVTELHLAGSKLQVAGISRDAPSLIPLIEQSAHFTRATFYAPTTRSPSDPGERFHIEVRIEPRNTVSP